MIRSRFEWICSQRPSRPAVGRAADGGTATVTRKFEAMMNDLVLPHACQSSSDEFRAIMGGKAVRDVFTRQGAAPSPRVDRTCFQRLKLKFYEPLSNFGFHFNLRPSESVQGRASLHLCALRRGKSNGGAVQQVHVETRVECAEVQRF